MTRIVLAIVLVIIAGHPAQTQTPTFSARRDAVRVDVLVTDNGHIVEGLTAADFEVRDNGVLQRVDLVSASEIPLAVVLAFDASASVAGERLDDLRVAADAALAGLATGDRAALLTFNHGVEMRQPLTPDRAAVQTAIAAIDPAGGTALVDGTQAALMLGDVADGRSVVLVFSDGVDTASWLRPARVVEAARRSGALVYAVSVRGRDKPRFLLDVTASTGGDLFEVASSRDLRGAFARVMDELRRRYLVSFSPEGVAPSGWHRLDVRVKGRRLTVKARPGYEARQ